MFSVSVPNQQDGLHLGVIIWQVFVASLLFVYGALVLGAFWLVSVIKLLVIRAWLVVTMGPKLDFLSPMDVMMLLLNPEQFTNPICPMTINHAIVVRGNLNLSRFSRMVQDRLIGARNKNDRIKFPTLTKRVVQKFGYFVWEEDANFSLANHVRLHHVSYSDATSLAQQLQDLQPVPLPKHHPLWEFVLVPKTVHSTAAEEEEYAIIFRIHHCMADGVYTMLMMTEMGDQDTSNLLPDIDKSVERKMPTLLQTNPFLRYLLMPKSTKLTLQNAFTIAINLLEILVKIPWYASEKMMLKDETNALSLPSPVLSGRKLMAVSDKLDLRRFKSIAVANHCTVNDVLLRCVTEALRRCNALLPVQTDSSVRVVLPMFFYPPSWSLQNSTSICTVTLPLQDAASSLECLHNISGICKEVKSSLEPLCNRLTVTAIVSCLPTALSRYLMSQLSFSLMASNMCGPATNLSYDGDEVIDTFFMPPSSGKCAVYFGLLSFKNQVRISVVVDRMVAPNDDIARQLNIYVEEELRNLHEATELIN